VCSCLRKDNFTIVMVEAGGRDRDAGGGIFGTRGLRGGGTCRLSGHNSTAYSQMRILRAKRFVLTKAGFILAI